MKKIYTLVLFCFLTIIGSATKWTIAVSNFQFSPKNTNAMCGDTIIWAWASGSHTTTSTTIPGCATAWNANLNSTSITYSITVPCAGTYSYQCTPHASSGMVGTIVVGCSNGISSYNTNYFSTAYPNPFTSKLTIETSEADLISIYNAVGENVKNISPLRSQTKTEIDMRDLQSGIYFYAVLKEGVIVETKKIIKN